MCLRHERLEKRHEHYPTPTVSGFQGRDRPSYRCSSRFAGRLLRKHAWSQVPDEGPTLSSQVPDEGPTFLHDSHSTPSARRPNLAFTRYCYYQYCMVYSIQTRGRRGGRILPNSCAIALHHGGQCRWGGARKRGFTLAQKI